jgi:hypothetical protein
LRLQVATAEQVVQVEPSRQTVDTEDAVTGQVVDRKFINDLPLVDRYVPTLSSLRPVSTTRAIRTLLMIPARTLYPMAAGASADILMDGTSITNFEPNGGITQLTYTPSAEAVDEFKVQQSNFSAEYGFSGASVVNMITRSGTNSFHGSAYDFIRNQITDANNWFNNEFGIPIPPVHRNNCGGTFGGPILKNKIFFFFEYDGTRSSDMNTYQAGVPSAAERKGDFCEICAASGGAFDANGLCNVITGQLYDPYSGTFQTPANGPAGAYRSAYIPFNNIATYTSPGNPNLNGTPYQLPPALGTCSILWLKR